MEEGDEEEEEEVTGEDFPLRSARGPGVGGGRGSGASVVLPALCSKKSREWVAVQACFNPRGVAWLTKAGVTSRRTPGRVEKFGVFPLAFPMALLQLAVRQNGVRVCSFLALSDKVREWVVKEFRLPADQVRVLRGKFEEEVKKFQGAEQRVRETCGVKRQGGASLMEKERMLRDAATAHNKRAQGLLEQRRAP